jgi:hypothetical protein
VLRLLEPAHGLGDVADARQRLSAALTNSVPHRVHRASAESFWPAAIRACTSSALDSIEPGAPARDGLMERDAMVRIPFVLAQCLKAGECGAVVAAGDQWR